MPPKDQSVLAMRWFTFLYIPLIPLGWQLIKGAGGRKYYVLRSLTHAEVTQALGPGGTWKAIGRTLFGALIGPLVGAAILIAIIWFSHR